MLKGNASKGSGKRQGKMNLWWWWWCVIRWGEGHACPSMLVSHTRSVWGTGTVPVLSERKAKAGSNSVQSLMSTSSPSPKKNGVKEGRARWVGRVWVGAWQAGVGEGRNSA